MCYAPRYTEVSKLGTCILWAIVRAKDFRDAMLCKHLFQQQDNLVGIALARWKMLNEDYLGVEVAHYQVVNSFYSRHLVVIAADCSVEVMQIWT